jgi:uncharacterized protein
MKIKNKVIVITGGTRGLGAAMKSDLAAKGNKIIVIARSINRTCFTNKENVLNVKADVTREADIKKIASRILKKFNHIDIWINNAGIWLPHAPIESMNMERVHQMIETNLFGTIYGSKHALIQMKKQKSGIIVNIISSSALAGSPRSSGYCASKFAVSGFTKSLRLEAADYGIKVIAVYPRGIRTSLFDEERPASYYKFMDSSYVAQKIICNLEKSKPCNDLIIKS